VNGFGVTIVGERINPGFKSSKALFDNDDFRGIAALAQRQAAAGADYLNLNAGARAVTDPGFVADVVRAVQAAVSLPLSFDVPGAAAQAACLKAYDRARAGGALPVVNSVTEYRWDLMDLYEPLGPFKVIVMASERVEDGKATNNTSAQEIYATAKRSVLRLVRDYGLAPGDVFVDVSVSAVVADRAGLNRSTLDAVRLIGSDPELKGVHMIGGLSNIGQHLPPKAADGSDLKYALECAFLTLAVPYGFDTVLGTPWRGYRPLPPDNPVLIAYRQFLEQSGSNALRAVRKFYRA
jgi:5-methyltetrahydrofolate--homocysteine methyltransferase